MDANQLVIGEGLAGASNPLRVGIAGRGGGARSDDNACASAKLRRADLVAAQIGLAGARRRELRERMRETLTPLGIGEIEVVTDANIALYGATGGAPGLVVIAGTGSICCGINARLKRFCAGGWGPIAGDEGGGAWLARRALRAVAYASDGWSPNGATDLACAYFHVTSSEISPLQLCPTIHERLAGFGETS